MEMGGEAGARVICRFAIPVSADTILRLLRRIELAEPGILRAIGVDDWAFKKGRDYGTIIVDLERHETVDLLPDREAKTLQTWLEEHPGIEVISRDRANAYIEGATKGAPDAVQVADRWHLLVNLSDAVCRMMETHPAELKAAAQLVQENPLEEESTQAPIEEDPVPKEAGESAEPQPLSYREARFQEVKTLSEQGHGIREIARYLHMSRKTIRKGSSKV
jgi:DNA-binding NarL/FixJ family response regulator